MDLEKGCRRCRGEAKKEIYDVVECDKARVPSQEKKCLD